MDSPITKAVRVAAASVGFDLVAELPRDRYDALAAAEHRLPDVGPADALCVLVANSRALWPVFMEACRRRPALLKSPDPLDRWTVEVLEPVFSAAAALAGTTGVAVATRYAYEAPPRRVGMQRLAQVAGLAHVGPAHLALHPEFGPWIGLRAVAVFDVACQSTPMPAPDPCSGCPGQPCLGALERSLALGEEATWRDWLRLRDACPQGREHRYSEQQVTYHYSKDTAVLAP